MSAGPLQVRMGSDNWFRDELRIAASQNDRAAGRLIGQIEKFALDPDLHGKLLRVASDGKRLRYLIPASGGTSAMDVLVAVADVRAPQGVAILLRLHEVTDISGVALFLAFEIQRAERDYMI